jgi:Tfp pilus assembly protein PilO
MNRLSKRERMLVGGALLVALLLGIVFYVVEPRWAEIRELEENRIPAREQLLAKARARLAQQEAIRKQLAELSREAETLARRFLPGATPALAASDLQKQVKALATAAGVEVRSERILPTVERGELLEIPVEITVSGGIREVTTLLYRLEGTTTLLTLQDLKVRVISVGQPRQLLTTLTLSGFILSSGSAQKAERPSGSPKG